MSKEAWDFLELLVTVLVAPAVMWYLNHRQTKTISKKVEQVEEKVNGNLDVRDQRIRALERQIRDKGDVPGE